MDKVREEFEMWLNTKGISFDFSVYLNKYTDKKIQNRYEAWKTSREYIVVKIPKEGEASSFGNYIVFDSESVVKMLEEAGVRYE